MRALHAADLVVVDSLTRVLASEDVEENDNAGVARFARAFTAA